MADLIALRKKLPDIMAKYDAGERPITATAEEYRRFFDYLRYDAWDGKPHEMHFLDTTVKYV